MGIIRLTLFTAIGLGGAFMWLGREDGLPEDRIGRAPSEIPQDVETVSFSSPRPTDIAPDMTDTGQAASANADEVTRQEPQPVALTTTAEPEQAATPQPIAVEKVMLSVTGSKVNVRGGPSTSYGVIASLKYGDKVTDMGDAGGGWRTIQLSSGDRGYMASRFLTASSQ
ncbi:MAG: SH3 domain-containing protein [Maritimibacter sp.]